MNDHPIRLAMVGGGKGAFIGPVHRMAAELDRSIELVAGCFSRDPETSLATAQSWGINTDRIYADYSTLITKEAARPDGAQLIAIVTPNATHFDISKKALEAGLSVICDKPATATLNEALALEGIVAKTKGLYALTFTYTGYPLVREARQLVASGTIGKIRKVTVDYTQGWLWRAVEKGDSKQADWRTDPAQAGQGGCIGDIGVHAFNLAEYVSGDAVHAVCADLSSMIDGRILDDDCNMLLRFKGGAPGVFQASQVAPGARNDLSLKVWGDKGGIFWCHEQQETLTIVRPDQPVQTYHAGESYLQTAPHAGTNRLPTGHPQGFIEAFANIYSDMAGAVKTGTLPKHVPGIRDGVRSMKFIDAALTSSKAKAWVKIEEKDRT
jgi:predicted dehydrogenase